MAETRRMTKANVGRKGTSDDTNYWGLFLFLGTFFFMIYANQYKPANPLVEEDYNRIVITEQLEPKPQPEPQLDYKYLENLEVRARPNPPETMEIGLELEVPVKNELVLSNTVEARRLHSSIGHIIFTTEVPLLKEILEANSNKFLFRLVLLEDTYGNRYELYNEWVNSLRNVLNGNILFRIQEYYANRRGTYRLFDNYAYFGETSFSGVVDISIYRNQTCADYTLVHVF